jgi:hypothetical protein
MPIYIAKKYDGIVESVVLAKSYELANAYWQGMGILPHSIDTRNENDLKDHPTGVLPIVTAKEKVIRSYDISSRTGEMRLMVVEK